MSKSADHRYKPNYAAIAKSSLIDVAPATGEYVSVKSTPGLVLSPLATMRDLRLSTVPSSRCFTLNTHMHGMTTVPGGRSDSLTFLNTPKLSKDWYSLSIEFIHWI